MLAALSFERASLPTVHCAGCGGEALVWLDPVDEALRCLACDALVDPDAVRRVGEKTAEAMGYAFLDKLDKIPKKVGGCGSKTVGGCGPGGCATGCSTT